ncbi:hypothetical protein B296_00058843 [Ensete ventricosum]|uniref:Uncharacterized protein n=1 Tax=Ensete ventricosum TaxID=4639 RepID=A0A426X1E0_ENSVE|nr:hypothetical protein B296_00058843 [Ensete ventricosum]
MAHQVLLVVHPHTLRTCDPHPDLGAESLHRSLVFASKSSNPPFQQKPPSLLHRELGPEPLPPAGRRRRNPALIRSPLDDSFGPPIPTGVAPRRTQAEGRDYERVISLFGLR